MQERSQWDYIIVGSGFGGSVSAMRLAQKGYKVCVIEKGKRFRAQDFPKTNWSLSKYFWAPRLRWFGIQQLSLLNGFLLLHGSGVGGGSLVYANTLMEPKPEVLSNPEWPQSVAWHRELKPFYELARLMLGAVPNPHLNEGERALEQLSQRLHCGESFHRTEIGVFFGAPDILTQDPYFAGLGPPRVGCNQCGGCMIGCRYNAKNTLDKNYLFFAEKWGAQIFPELTVDDFSKEGSRFVVRTSVSTSWRSRRGPEFEAPKVILAAGVLGSVNLLLKLRHKFPDLSPTLGQQVRTNGESLLGATSFDSSRDLSKGVAIGAAIHPNSNTKIENVRYPSGSSAMRLLAVPLTGPGNFLVRPLKMIGNIIWRFPRILKLMFVGDWAKRTLILLVMQNIDQKINLVRRRSLFGFGRQRLSSTPTTKPIPSYNELAQTSARELAQILNGEPQNVFSEVVFDTPATAHILGGCAIADSPKEGVVDTHQEVFGISGLFVCDGSVVPSNLGVNPSLTISALTERCMSKIPVKPGANEKVLNFSKSQPSPTSPGGLNL